jgi:hypothetical protein
MMRIAGLVWMGAMLSWSVMPVRQQQNPIPEKFTNLQVLPKSITRAELVPIMRSFALGLGVRCEHCHVGEGNDLSKFDFAADTKPPKDVARRMMRMLDRIEREDLKGLGDPARQPKLSCYTCHRGEKTPAVTRPPG